MDESRHEFLVSPGATNAAWSSTAAKFRILSEASWSSSHVEMAPNTSPTTVRMAAHTCSTSRFSISAGAARRMNDSTSTAAPSGSVSFGRIEDCLRNVSLARRSVAT